MKNSKVSKLNESGLVSIVVVTTITIILALMTVAFTRIMNRNLREAVDLELSTQAHYAAESGLNDARQYVADKVSAGEDPSIGPDCLNLTSPPSQFVSSISGSYSGDANDNTVKYTCVLIDATPKNITDTIAAGSSKVYKLTPAFSGQQIVKLYISWQNNNISGNPEPLMTKNDAATHRLPQESGPGGIDTNATGLLRTAIYPWPGDSSLPADNGSLTTLSKSYFMYPNADNGSGTPIPPKQIGNVNYASNGSFVNGQCNQANMTDPPPLPSTAEGGMYCNSSIDGIPASDLMYVRLSAVYQDLKISIQGADAQGKIVPIAGAQAIIDVTGEGNDILKRIQARTPLTPLSDSILPQYAIQSMDTLCKRLRLPKTGSGASDYGDAVLDDPANGQDNVCLPQP